MTIQAQERGFRNARCSSISEQFDSIVMAGRPKKEESYSARLMLLVQRKRKSEILIVERDAIKPEMENFYNVCFIFSKTFLTKLSNKPMMSVVIA